MSNVGTSSPAPSSLGLNEKPSGPSNPAQKCWQGVVTLADGQLVTIDGPCGACRGQVLHVEQPCMLASAHRAAEIERARAILAERDIVELALIRRHHNSQPVIFIALRNSAGTWHDLDRQPLTITPLTLSRTDCATSRPDPQE